MLMNGLLTVSSMIFPLITYPYITRVMLPDAVGRVVLASSVAAYFAMFAQLGVPVYGVRECARVRDSVKQLSRTTVELLLLNMIICIPVLLCYAAALLTIPRLGSEMSLFAVMGVSIVLTAINTDWFYQAIEEYSYITVRSLLFKLIAVIAMFLLIHSPEDYVIYGGISVFAASASSIMNLIRLKKYITAVPLKECRPFRHVRFTLRFFMLSVMTGIYTNLDVVMLGLMKDDTAVSYYGIAVKIKLMLASILISFVSVLLPRTSRQLGSNDREGFVKLIGTAVRLTLSLSVPLTLFFIFFSDESIILLAGGRFSPAAGCMRIIMPTLILIGISNVLGIQVLVPLGHEGRTVTAACIGAAVDFTLNLIVIPEFSYIGAAAATLTAEGFVLAYIVICTRKCGIRIMDARDTLKIAAAAAAALAVSLAAKFIFSTAAATLPAAAVIYAIAYTSILLLTGERIAADAWKRLRNRNDLSH